MTETNRAGRHRAGLRAGPADGSWAGEDFGGSRVGWASHISTTVNRASQLTAVARPRTVLVDDALAASLTRVSGFEMSPMPRRVLRGIGPVTRGPSGGPTRSGAAA